jgi:hypothetical protein
MKPAMIISILCVCILSCASTGGNPPVNFAGRAEKLARDISLPVSESRFDDVKTRMLYEMSIAHTTGVFLINERGETILGFISDEKGDAVPYHGDFKTILLSNDDEIDESLVFYRNKMLGLVRIIQTKK